MLPDPFIVMVPPLPAFLFGKTSNYHSCPLVQTNLSSSAVFKSTYGLHGIVLANSKASYSGKIWSGYIEFCLFDSQTYGATNAVHVDFSKLVSSTSTPDLIFAQTLSANELMFLYRDYGKYYKAKVKSYYTPSFAVVNSNPYVKTLIQEDMPISNIYIYRRGTGYDYDMLIYKTSSSGEESLVVKEFQ